MNGRWMSTESTGATVALARRSDGGSRRRLAAGSSCAEGESAARAGEQAEMARLYLGISLLDRPG